MTKATKRELKRITDTIVRRYRPEKIILFGSYAWGRPHPDSDMDLFVVKKTRRSTRTVASEIDDALWGRSTPLDLIVSTPQKVSESIRNGNLFIRSILERGQVLYER